MTPEEYERLKEAEKEHLRALKRLKKAVREHERSKSIARAVTRMGSSSDSALEENSDLVDKLAMETAHYEARLEVALESAGEKAQKALKAEELEKLNEDLHKERARSLVDRIRDEMAGTDTGEPEPSASRPETPSRPPEAAESDSSGQDPLPEKTIGRMRRDSADDKRD